MALCGKQSEFGSKDSRFLTSHVNVSPIHELTQRSLRNLRNDDALVDLLYSMFVQSC